VRAITSERYRSIGTRHRPPMFSDYLEKVLRGGPEATEYPIHSAFLHPSII
jgi:hypothetical protein